MCDHGACRGVGQLLGPSNPRVELVVESKQRRRRHPRPSHPQVHLVVEPQRRVRQLLQPLAGGEPVAVTVPCHWKDWNDHLEGHRQWALTNQKVCGTVLDDGGEPRGHDTRDGAQRRWSLLVHLCSHGRGSIRAASGTTLGPPGTRKLKENRRFYGFTDFRGKPAGRGRGSHRPPNQVTAPERPKEKSRAR